MVTITCRVVNLPDRTKSGPIIRLDQTVPAIHTVKILKFGTPQTIAIIVLKIEKFAVTLH